MKFQTTYLGSLFWIGRGGGGGGGGIDPDS